MFVGVHANHLLVQESFFGYQGSGPCYILKYLGRVRSVYLSYDGFDRKRICQAEVCQKRCATATFLLSLSVNFQ